MQIWNSSAYQCEGRFVADLAEDLVALLAPQAGERILDLGCGVGTLTAKLQASGARVLGLDASESMVEAARQQGLSAQWGDGQQLAFESEFDAVFSNAALHWMTHQEAVLAGVYRALRPGGRFVAEMGGQGNIAAIRTALRAVCARFGVEAEDAGSNVFFTAEAYRALLERAGFTVDTVTLLPRPTRLPNSGLEGWLHLFRRGLLDRFAPEERTTVIEQTTNLLRPTLCDPEGNWTADYVRLRFRAYKSE